MKNTERYRHILSEIESFFADKRLKVFTDCPGIRNADFVLENGEPGEIKHAGELYKSQFKSDWNYWNIQGRRISAMFSSLDTTTCDAAVKGFLAVIAGQLRRHVEKVRGRVGWLVLEIAPYWRGAIERAIVMSRDSGVIVDCQKFVHSPWIMIFRFTYK